MIKHPAANVKNWPILDALKNGKSVAEIHRVLGVSKSRIYRIMRRLEK